MYDSLCFLLNKAFIWFSCATFPGFPGFPVSRYGENSHQIYESSHQNIGFPGFPGIAKLHWTFANV